MYNIKNRYNTQQKLLLYITWDYTKWGSIEHNFKNRSKYYSKEYKYCSRELYIDNYKTYYSIDYVPRFKALYIPFIIDKHKITIKETIN